jgi:hypothetical protein
MKEYQFKVPSGVWLDVHANTEDEAVAIVNASLDLLDEPLSAPGAIQRVQVDVQEPMTRNNIEYVYDLDTGESFCPTHPPLNDAPQSANPINGLIEALEAAIDLIDQYETEPEQTCIHARGHSVTRNACNDVLRIAKAKMKQE